MRRCAAEIVRKYADLRIVLAGASNVVLAERHDTSDILTTDERHFRVLRESARTRGTSRLLSIDAA